MSLLGTVYLLHFDTPFKHARHYTGWSGDLPLRLAEHAAGHGARLTEVVAAAGIGWTLARTWPNTTRSFERRLKNQGGAARRCPLCGVRPRTAPIAVTVPELPGWTYFRDEGGRLRCEAECELCHVSKPPLTFDLSITHRHLCWDCVEPAPA